VPTAQLASPFNGATVSLQSLLTRPYIDVTFTGIGAGGTIAWGTVRGDEIKLSGPGAQNLDLTTSGVIVFPTAHPTPELVSGTTYRYYVKAKATVTDQNALFLDGQVVVELPAGTWSAHYASGPDVSVGRGAGTFTVDAQTRDSGTASAPFSLGPLSIAGPSISLVDTKFDKGILTLTIGIGADSATLAFGGSNGQQTAGQSQNGISATLTGILATFDVQVDILQAVQALQNPSALLAAFSVPGKFGLKVASLNVTVPNIVVVTATGIAIKYDPSATGSQELLRVDTATVSFPAVGLSASIGTSSTRPYGLIVRSDGFDLGHLDITYRPGQGGAPATIGFGDIIRFNDIRLGVENFSFTSGATASFSGDIFLASGGVSFLPGRPVSASITDSPSDTDTEAVRATLEFTNGHISAFKFHADTMLITLGSVLTLTARDFFVDTGASATEALVSFASVGAQVNVGGIAIGGEARNFQFNGDGSFHTRPGFGVFLSVGGANGDSFKWPSWLPIQINALGIQWADIEHHPENFVITLSAAVTGIKGIAGLTFSGSVEGVKIDVGKLLAGEFPITEIAAFGVQVKGTMFGGTIDAQLIGGILRLDQFGNMIDTLDSTTPVAQRVFYAGLEGGFTMPGVGGLTIRLGLSELGPLGVYLAVSLPTGIMLVPQIGLVMNDFAAGVEFFKTLAVDRPAGGAARARPTRRR